MAAWFGACFPVSTDTARCEVTEARREEGGVFVTYRFVTFEYGEVRDVKEQEVGHRPLDEDSVRVIANTVRARLSDQATDLAVAMPYDLVRPLRPYQRVRVPSRPGQPEPWRWRQDLLDAIHAQAHADGFEERFEHLDDWANAPRTVYFLWLGVAMLGGNGCEVFLGQNDVEEVVGVLKALDEAGCERFAALYRTALFIARRERSSEFLLCVDDDWLDAQVAEPADPNASWHEIDSHAPGGTYALLESEVKPALSRYIEQHRDLLVE